MTSSHRRLAALATAVALVAVAACSDGRSTEAFCDQVEATLSAGPLFPDRTDGEPVPSADALDAIEELGDVAPDEIRDAVDVLVAEAGALVAEAEDRNTTTTDRDEGDDGASEDAPARPEREAVDAAQSEVVAFAERECEVDLGR